MNAPHHLARQIIEGGDVEREHRKGDLQRTRPDGPSSRGPETRRKSVAQKCRIDLDGLSALSLQHYSFHAVPAPLALYDLMRERPRPRGKSRPSLRASEAIHRATRGGMDFLSQMLLAMKGCWWVGFGNGNGRIDKTFPCNSGSRRGFAAATGLPSWRRSSLIPACRVRHCPEFRH